MRFAYVTSRIALDRDADLPILQRAAQDREFEMAAVHWDDPGVDWAAFDAVVVRSCWDYITRREEFLAWADTVPHLHNSAPILRWNTDKTYLRELETSGVPIIPTLWDLREGDDPGPATEWVVKPAVSSGSKGTARWDDLTQVYAHSEALQRDGHVSMTQPYVASVDDEGETAMLFYGGRFSHAVRKGPLLQLGEGIRDDRDGRGENRVRTPTDQQHEVARRAIDVATRLTGDTPLYARVDLVTGDHGDPMLIELELTEPYFFLEYAPEGASNLLRAIESLVS